MFFNLFESQSVGERLACSSTVQPALLLAHINLKLKTIHMW